MKNLSQLKALLDQEVSGTYLIHGPEELLALEAGDLIISSAKNSGFTERSILYADRKFNWQQLLDAANSLSLFCNKRLVDLRIVNGKPGKEGEKAIISVTDKKIPDLVLLIRLPELDRSTFSSAWFKKIDYIGTVFEVGKMSKNQLPQWIKHRLKAQQQTVDRETLYFLSEQVEGNLLAAAQEIKKIGLLFPKGDLNERKVRQAVLDVSQFDIWDISDAILHGDRKLLLRTLRGLKNEGVAPPLVLWAIVNEARALALVEYRLKSGDTVDQAVRYSGAWGKRKQLIPIVLNKLSEGKPTKTVAKAAEVDRIIKGIVPGESWDALASLGLSLIPGNSKIK